MLNKICCDVLCSVVQLGVLRNDGRELGEAEGYINMYSRKITSPNDDKESGSGEEPETVEAIVPRDRSRPFTSSGVVILIHLST